MGHYSEFYEHRDREAAKATRRALIDKFGPVGEVPDELVTKQNVLWLMSKVAYLEDQLATIHLANSILNTVEKGAIPDWAVTHKGFEVRKNRRSPMRIEET